MKEKNYATEKCSESRTKHNNCWLISKLHLSDPPINKKNCMLYIFNCIKIHWIIIFWLKFYVTATCDITFSLRLEAS